MKSIRWLSVVPSREWVRLFKGSAAQLTFANECRKCRLALPVNELAAAVTDTVGWPYEVIELAASVTDAKFPDV